MCPVSCNPAYIRISVLNGRLLRTNLQEVTVFVRLVKFRSPVGLIRATNCVLFNPLNAEFNPICHLLALLGAHHILHVSRVRVKH